MLQATRPTDNVLSTLADSIPDFAKKSGLVTRISAKFCPTAFFISLIQAVANGKSSFSQLCHSMSLILQSRCLSTQALHQRLDRLPRAVESFLMHIIGHLLQQHFLHTDLNHDHPFARILVEDSSQLRTHKANAGAFPAHGNGSGDTAGCKINFCFELLSGSVINISLHHSTTQDKTLAPELTSYLQPGDLVLRDMGYFIIETFAHIETFGAYWLSRLPQSVDLCDTQECPLHEILTRAEKSGLNSIDIPVILGKEARHSTRLIAVRASAQEVQKRARQRAVRDKKRKRQSSHAEKQRDQWYLIVTNVKVEQQSVTALFKIYQQRWQIELVFRGWKENSKLHALLKRKSNETHLKALMLAAMIVLVMGMEQYAQCRSRIEEAKRERLSVEKVIGYTIRVVEKLRKLSELLTAPPDLRLLLSDKRTRKSLNYQQYECLC